MILQRPGWQTRARRIVTIALCRGWLRRGGDGFVPQNHKAPRPRAPRFPTPESREKYRDYMRHYMRAQRAKLYSAGLTQHGRPRVNKAHPELRGLSRAEYHRRYMQVWRNKTNTQHHAP